MDEQSVRKPTWLQTAGFYLGVGSIVLPFFSFIPPFFLEAGLLLGIVFGLLAVILFAITLKERPHIRGVVGMNLGILGIIICVFILLAIFLTLG